MKRKLHSTALTALHWWRRARDERLYLVFFICLQKNRMIMHYSDDTPYWHPILYSPLFILYWRRQILPPFSLKILWSSKSCNPFPPTPRKALYYSDDTPYWQSILYSPLFILYWRRQIPPSVLLENLVIPKILQPAPPPPLQRLCIILMISLIDSQFSIVPSLYSVSDDRSPLHSPWKSCDPLNPATTPPPSLPKAKILTGLKVKLLFTGGILHLISGWRYNKLFEGLFLFRKIIIV